MEWTDSAFLASLIAQLNPADFADLCNTLLMEIAAEHGIGRSSIASNLRTSEPDGGIDARCVGSIHVIPRIVPRSNVDYQFKSGGATKSASRIVEEDILGKNRVAQGLRNGNAFVYMAAWDRGDAMEDSLRQELELRDLVVESDQVVFIGADALARILIAFPGIVARFLRLDVPLLSLDDWQRFPSLRNPYQTDFLLDAQLAELRLQIEQARDPIRVVGAAGDGKTRTVLEALRASSLEPSVLYAREPGDVTRSFLSHLARTPDVRCTLVIDEVDDRAAIRLKTEAALMPGGVRFVMIGLDASGRSQSDTMQVSGLSEDVLIRTIRSIAIGLPEETARSIARDCEHSPKLAVIIAQRILDNPDLLVPHKRLSDGKVRSALDQYLDIEYSTPAWKALSTTALFTRLGWTDDAETESEILFQVVGLDPIDARRHVERLNERMGIAPLAGRYRYVSPSILADHLAARQLEVWTHDRMRQFLASLTPAMAESFVRRARRLSAALSNRRVVEEVILGDQGPFRSLSDLEASGMAVLLRRLAGPFPRATLGAVRRIVEPASKTELLNATASRRELVWAIVDLLWPEETFEDASRLLLRLAAAENETWGNNASGTWVESFQTVLGRTAAGLQPRVRVLKSASSSSDAVERGLAARAIGAAMKTEHVSRAGMPPTDVEGMPNEVWQPASWQDWQDAALAYLEILHPLLSDSDESVKAYGSAALRDGLNGAMMLPFEVLDRWAAIAREVGLADQKLRSAILETIELAYWRWERRITSEIFSADSELNSSTPKQALDAEREARVEKEHSTIRRRLAVLDTLRLEFKGTDFMSRLKAVLHQPYLPRPGKSYEDLEADVRKKLEELAIEALAQPSLLDDWQWLGEEKDSYRIARWIDVLGSLDRARVFEPDLRRATADRATSMFLLSVYDLAYARATLNPGFVDQRIGELEQLNVPMAQQFDLLFRAGYSPARLKLFCQKVGSKAVPADSIANLSYHPWGPNIPAQEALRISEDAESNGASVDAVISFVSAYISQQATSKALFLGISTKLISRAAETSSIPDSLYQWSQLAKSFVSERSVEIAEAAMHMLIRHHLVRDDELKEVLTAAWEVGDKRELFERVFAPALTSGELESWYLREALRHFPFWELGEPYLIEWVSRNPKERAFPLANVLGAPSELPSELHVALLERYSDAGVIDAFRSDFNSGSWVGSSVDWTLGRMKRAQTWLRNEHPSIRAWADQLVVDLNEELQRNIAREAEDKLFY